MQLKLSGYLSGSGSVNIWINDPESLSERDNIEFAFIYSWDPLYQKAQRDEASIRPWSNDLPRQYIICYQGAQQIQLAINFLLSPENFNRFKIMVIVPLTKKL